MFWYVDWILLWNLVIKYILLFWVLYGFWFIVVVLMIVVVNNKNVGMLEGEVSFIRWIKIKFMWKWKFFIMILLII